jgi:hypothetical protein
MRPARAAVALLLLVLVATACAEVPAQHAARLEVERVATKAGRSGDTKCTSNPKMFFAEGPAATVFICLVKVGGGVCDRYIVKKEEVRLQLREVNCMLRGT